MAVSVEVYNPDGLIAGEHPVESVNGTITGGDFARGTLLGRVTATGAFTISDDSASDGSEVPVAVLATDADASAGDVTAAVYIAGDFDDGKVIYGGNHTADSVRWTLAGRSIYLKQTN